MRIDDDKLVSNIPVEELKKEQLKDLEFINSYQSVKDLVISMIKEQNIPLAIGYTKVFLSEENDNANDDIQLMSATEYFSHVVLPPNEMHNIGNPLYSPYNALVLSTGASIVGTGTFAGQIAATSSAEWVAAVTGSAARSPWHNKYDYISLIMPNGFTIHDELLTHSSTWLTVPSYKAVDEVNAMTYGVKMRSGDFYATDVKLSAYGIPVDGVVKKIMSTYVHNYNSLGANLNCDVNGISFSYTPVASTWQVASSVII